MKTSKVVATGIISGLFVFGVCQIQNAVSAPQSARSRIELLKARFLQREERIRDRFGRGRIPNPSWQPVECLSGPFGTADCDPNNSASFISSNGQVQLQVVGTQAPSCTQSRVGAQIVLPEGTPANSISFDKFNDVESGPAALRVLVIVYDSNGNEIGRADTPNELTNSGISWAFDLHNLPVTGSNSNVPEGATMRTVLLVVTTKNTVAFGTSRITNLRVNGSLVEDAIFQSTCAAGFYSDKNPPPS